MSYRDCEYEKRNVNNEPQVYKIRKYESSTVLSNFNLPRECIIYQRERERERERLLSELYDISREDMLADRAGMKNTMRDRQFN